ncbi:subtilisin-like protein [Gloeophyllum trabeum ATCC 11539]|uniref:tripeptidyl-peptidase II n=1 Tax=Gloeophyllum trabeum (strain ATCC 11539 / FP-39264 / Madison 617) TaxID=670483 RepID=S7QHA7_GLOTA|nr:subtilisin-like protein [Gloeophyllum trabeum ATCC 11539]EPQ59186.1 subtilisin-like protein [Gloeophyllum trabeum ATCC 11539]
MKVFVWLSVVLYAVSVTVAAPQGCTHKVKEQIEPPRGWVKLAPAPPDHIIHLRIALLQPNFTQLEQALYEVSDPDHARYGQHLSKEQVEELVAPHSESINVVDEWLASLGIQQSELSRSSAKDWVKVKVPVSLAEKMLDTTYHVWQHTESGDTIVRTTHYGLPEDVHGHVELVQPTTIFSRFRGMKTTYRLTSSNQQASDSGAASIRSASGTVVDASCNSTITITCLKELYNATGYNSSATNGNTIGITGYLEQYANFMDLQSFYAQQRPDAVNSTFKVTLINGGQNNQTLSAAGIEADLDVEFAFGLTYPTPSYFYSTGGSPPFIPDMDTPTDTNEPYAEWLDYILGVPNPPQTISTSYGDDEQTVPESYAQRVCASFAQLGARGVSLMFSSGDGGVGDGDPDPATQTCYTNDGRNVTRFIPGFPASCPYVTAVGGTTYVPEVAVFFSGGGFSIYFAQPSYQTAAVASYLAKLAPGTYQGLYNPYGRAIPDVSAQANYFLVWNAGEPIYVGGTSASSPTFTGFVSLLNDALISAGRPPLGFLNPFLYSRGVAGLTDITAGNNPGCGTEGFNATVGWDPGKLLNCEKSGWLTITIAVTGLGTPNFGLLKDIVLS